MPESAFARIRRAAAEDADRALDQRQAVGPRLAHREHTTTRYLLEDAARRR